VDREREDWAGAWGGIHRTIADPEQKQHDNRCH
jgi:hypothetical protein